MENQKITRPDGFGQVCAECGFPQDRHTGASSLVPDHSFKSASDPFADDDILASALRIQNAIHAALEMPMPPLVTTDHSLRRDLNVSLERQRGISAGQTWREFKAAMVLLGVGDDDRVASIEFGIRSAGSGRIVREDAPDGVEIKELGYGK